MMSRLFRCFYTLMRERSGNSAVEFALLAPILLLLLTGTIDLGLGFQEKMRVQSALNSGMQHAMQTEGRTIATTRQVIEHGLGVNSGAQIDVRSFCRCSGSSSPCPPSCTPGQHRFTSGSVLLPYKTTIFGFDMTLSANFEIYVGRAR